MFENCPRCNSSKVVTRRNIKDNKVSYIFKCKICSLEILKLSLSKEKDKIRRDIEKLVEKIEQSKDIKLVRILERRISRYGSISNY